MLAAAPEGAAARRPDRDQGRVAAAMAGAAVRRGGDAGAGRAGRVRPLPRLARRRGGARRRRQHARAGRQQHRQHLRLRGRPQPLEPGALPGRLLQRPGGIRRRAPGCRCGRRRRRRLDPLPRRLLRPHRPEADLRPLGDGGAPHGRGLDHDRLRRPLRRRRRLPPARFGPLRRRAAGGSAQRPADRRHPRRGLRRRGARGARGLRGGDRGPAPRNRRRGAGDRAARTGGGDAGDGLDRQQREPRRRHPRAAQQPRPGAEPDRPRPAQVPGAAAGGRDDQGPAGADDGAPHASRRSSRRST